jgi:hypothetical protein
MWVVLEPILHTLCGTCIIWSAEPWLIPSCKATSTVVTRWFSCITHSKCSTVSGAQAVSGQPVRSASATLYTTFFNFPSHSYICYSDKQASPNFVFILLWISLDFTPSLHKKWITECCSSLVHVSRGTTIFNCPSDIKYPVLPTFLFPGH